MSTDLSRDEILGRVQRIVGQVVGNPSIVLTEATRASDVSGWDSLNHVQIIMSVEREFGLRMKAIEVAQLENAGSLIDIVCARHRG